MMRALALALALAGCGGGGGSPSSPPVTIPDPVAYLAQSRHCDGNPATPLRASDPITCRRFDFGHYQATDSFLVEGGAITAMSFPPWGPFAVQPDGYGAHGDGGEKMLLAGDAVQITHTQDGGTLGVQVFSPPWTVLTIRTANCPDWTAYNLRERGCRATVAYPMIGPVDSVVSEHGDDNAVERIFLGRGWGRVAWQTFQRGDGTPLVADLAQRCPDFGWNHPPKPGQRLVDCRIAVHVEPADGSLTGAQLWKP